MVSKRTAGIAPSVTLAISAKAKQMKADGIDVIGFGAGEPDFDTPEHIKQAGIDAIKSGFTKYTPSGGIPELKKAVCAKFQRDNNITYDPSEVIISCGGKHSLYNIMQAILDEGDEVILPAPYWVTYIEQIRLSGGKEVIVDTGSSGFRLTANQVEKAVTAKTKLLILNSPSNPTGAVISKEELEKIAALAVKHRFFVLSDEVYEKLIYGSARHISIASLGEDIKRLTLTMNAVSKTYSMTGWRIGYAAGPKEIIKAMDNLQSHTTSNPCSIAQKAALAALSGDHGFLDTWVKAYDERRRYMVETLRKTPLLSCDEPDGAFYAFVDISKTGLSSMEFTERLLEEAKVAVIPGKDFGADTHIRLSYATSMKNIKEGLSRIDTFCRALGGAR